ncbi:hypothetical protein [Haliscomenobacter sp.]|jgi:hypothetical protein|uniref:hypothetical protein n=1 Tax=Haliscomenobacter sp. TaxID=2717303 RepID=UPI0033650A13
MNKFSNEEMALLTAGSFRSGLWCGLAGVSILIGGAAMFVSGGVLAPVAYGIATAAISSASAVGCGITAAQDFN